MEVARWRRSMADVLRTLRHWFGEAVQHAVGNPREEKIHQPPEVGVQPYRDQPQKAHQ